MTVGFVMLVHTALDRATQVARHLCESGNPVVVHVDARVSDTQYARLKQKLAPFEHVHFSQRLRCDWGSWSIVAATQTASELILTRYAEVSHIYLASGSCMPLRPISELREYLAARPDTDFIESVTTDEVDWTVGGLDQERFTLRFPFSWKRHRRLFDGYVNLQRRLKFHRHIPEGLVPHLGSQWWCLTRRTLSGILGDPRRSEYDRYFRRVWIPDESYFQTLVRRFGGQIESRSLTLSKFDFLGKPHVFYDDHAQLLRRSDCFFARKIWPQAEGLYRSFLEKAPATGSAAEPNSLIIDRLFSKAKDRRTRGRAGLHMPGRLPNPGWENGLTAGRYSVFQGFSELFENFDGWLSRRTGNRVHGHLFAPDDVQFADKAESYNGALANNTALRDYQPRGFLTNLIWNTRGEHQCFQFCPKDNQHITPFICSDGNAHVLIVTGAWAIPLFQSAKEVSDLRKEAARLQKIELQFVDLLRSGRTRARVSMWSLAEFIAGPVANLQYVLDDLGGTAQRQLTEVPKMADLTGFGEFLQNLKNTGMSPTLMGDFSVVDGPGRSDSGPRPYLVK